MVLSIVWIIFYPFILHRILYMMEFFFLRKLNMVSHGQAAAGQPAMSRTTKLVAASAMYECTTKLEAMLVDVHVNTPGSHAHVHRGNQARERPGQAGDQQYTLIKPRGKRVNVMAKYMYS
jgi:hypothetical protein